MLNPESRWCVYVHVRGGGGVSAHSCPADVTSITRLPQPNNYNCASGTSESF